jgi:hypothetical protein
VVKIPLFGYIMPILFYVWTPKGSSELEWTSLSGNEKMKMLKLLPEKLSESDVLHCNR